MSAINNKSSEEDIQIAELKSLLEGIAEKEAIKKRNRILRFMLKAILTVMIIASLYLILRYDVFERVFTPKQYWTDKVNSLELSIKSIEIIIDNNNFNGDKTKSQVTDDEFKDMVSVFQQTGMNKEDAIKKAEGIAQKVANKMEITSDMFNNRLAEFNKELAIAKHELSKY